MATPHCHAKRPRESFSASAVDVELIKHQLDLEECMFIGRSGLPFPELAHIHADINFPFSPPLVLYGKVLRRLGPDSWHVVFYASGTPARDLDSGEIIFLTYKECLSGEIWTLDTMSVINAICRHPSATHAMKEAMQWIFYCRENNFRIAHNFMMDKVDDNNPRPAKCPAPARLRND